MTNAEFFQMMQDLSQVLGGSAAGRANGLVNEANLTNQQNQGATSRYQALVNSNRLQNIEMPNSNLDQGTRGSVLSTWQPVSVGQTSVPYGSHTNGPVRPTITGGPSITPELRQLGGQVTKDALSRQMAGNPINTSTFPSDDALGMNAMPKSGVMDKLLGYGGMATSILGTLGKTGLLGGGGATSAIPASFGTATPPAGGGSSIPIGGGSSNFPVNSGTMNPEYNWGQNILKDLLKAFQNGGGSTGQYIPNPFGTGGGSGVEDKAASLIWGRPRASSR